MEPRRVRGDTWDSVLSWEDPEQKNGVIYPIIFVERHSNTTAAALLDDGVRLSCPGRRSLEPTT